MPRATKDSRLDTAAARARLPVQRKPHFRLIEPGLHVGYYRGERGGSWIARRYLAAGRYATLRLGLADDGRSADGREVLTFGQAQSAARDWATRAANPEPEPAAPYTVADAMRDYLEEYVERGGKSLQGTRTAIEAHILPALGDGLVSELTLQRVRAWHRGLAAAPARIRSAKGVVRTRAIAADPEALRKRRATANRLLTYLKAGLNFARSEGKARCSNDAWAAVRPFREADVPKIRYLLDEEITRLCNACDADFRDLVVGALMTGARYGELAAARVGDFDATAGALTIAAAKSGKPRHVVLTNEGVEFFKRLTAGLPGSALIFTRPVLVRQAGKHGPAEYRRGRWAKNDQTRHINAACAAARIEPAVTFHILRHTYASRLVARGAPLPVIAAQLGHRDGRMTEKHYAHLAPSFVSDAVRAAFGTLGIAARPVDGAEVMPFNPRPALLAQG